MDVTEDEVEESAMLKAVKSFRPYLVARLLNQGADVNSVIDDSDHTALHVASVLDDNLPCVKLLVERGANVNAKNAFGDTPLHIACLNGSANIVQCLIFKKALVNEQDSIGFTPFHMLAAKCRSTFKSRIIAEMLQRAGAELKMDHEGNTPLYYIWRYNKVSVMYLYLDTGVECIMDRYGNTVLHYAVRSVENTLLVSWFLRKGASINKQNEFGETALFRAVQLYPNGCAIIRVLILRGADVNVEDSKGETALVYAIRHVTNGHSPEVLESLIDKGANVNCKDAAFGETGLHKSVGNFEQNDILFNIFLKAGANLNEVDNLGNTVLHHAVAHGNTNALKRLLETDIDVDLQEKRGMTAFHLAVYLNKTDIADLLLERTFDTNVVCEFSGDMLLHRAVQNGSTDLLQKLIKMGVNLHHKNLKRMTALHLAAAHSYDDGVHMLLAHEVERISGESSCRNLFMSILKKDEPSLKKLLSNECDVNHKDSSGRTALHWAVLRRFSSGVDLLLSKGVNVNEQDCWGNTPLHLAVLVNEEAVLMKLLSNGAQVNLQDEDDRTALHFAATLPVRDGGPNHNDCSFLTDTLVKAGGLIDLQDCDGNTPLHLALIHNNDPTLRSLLIWGALTDSTNISGEPCLYNSIVRGTLCQRTLMDHFVCLNEANLNTYNDGLNPRELGRLSFNKKLRILYCVLSEKSHKKKCRKELKKMTRLKIGGFGLYDVLVKKNPAFRFNDELKSAIFSTSIHDKFPIYGRLLQAKLVKAELRNRRLEESLCFPLDAKSKVHLPVEVKLMIFSLLVDEDLVNLVRAV